MFGEDGEVRGLIPRSVEYLFESLARRSHSHEVYIYRLTSVVIANDRLCL